MRCIMVMYDTLCRHFLQPYGNDWVKTPNFTRLAERAVTFDTNYVCSLPCMPARRDLHNARANFLQRDWGPLEPYDDSMPQILKEHGIYSCLVSDHYHYWEDGGATYHNRYNSWRAHRGQEGDACSFDPEVVRFQQSLGKDVTNPQRMKELLKNQDRTNRKHLRTEEEMPQAKTFRDGMEFIEANHELQDWFLQIECFDPHEPFFTQPERQELYPEIAAYSGPKDDWPGYEPVRNETAADIRHVRNLYAALVSMCDDYLGKVLDLMDRFEMWKDTMLIVNTDHGFLLGEHDWWGKNIMPAYEEISHTPLFIYDPVSGIRNERRSVLTSAIDLPVTILDFFGLEPTADMQGVSLLPAIRENKKVRDSALFGFHASHVAVTDGEYVYFRAPLAGREKQSYEYTLMPTRMRQMFDVRELQKAELVPPLPNSKGCPVLRIPGHGSFISPVNFGTKLFRVSEDPRQKEPIADGETEARMAKLLKETMEKYDAPIEQFGRLGLDIEITPEAIVRQHTEDDAVRTPGFIPDAKWTRDAVNFWCAMEKMLPEEALSAFRESVSDIHGEHGGESVSYEDLVSAVRRILPKERADELVYFSLLVSRKD